MTEPEYVRLEIEPPLGIITLDRPDKLNAWSWASARQLTARADELRFDDSVRVVLLKAEGRAFCAGVDLGMPEDRITGRSPAEKTRNYYERFRWVHERFHVLADLPQPVIVAVHGYCLGAGLEIAMMGDIRIASEDAMFALPESGVGVGIDSGGDLRLVTEIGALRLGIVQEVVPADALLDHTRALCDEIAAKAPLAVQAIKRTINFWSERGMAEAMQFVAMSSAPNFVSDDMAEGYQAMAERREVRFEGK
jgi:enoyl-CoA hydratase